MRVQVKKEGRKGVEMREKGRKLFGPKRDDKQGVSSNLSAVIYIEQSVSIYIRG